MRKPPFRTVRCILRQGDKFLLVVHRGARKGGRPRWGLPGGHVEPREDPEQTARREMREELGIILGPLLEVGSYRYKGRLHKVLGTDYEGAIMSFRRTELLKIGWHTLDEVVALAQAGTLHSGYEPVAIADFLGLSCTPGPRR